MEIDDLLAEIRAVFPVVPMPSKRELRFHPDDCVLCECLSEDVDERRGKAVDAWLIRHICQDMGCLSSKAWVWVLPYYLSFCLTPEAEADGMETEFLIYNLGPSDEFKDETKAQLSALTPAQCHCLLRFLEWLSAHPHWKNYCPEHISSALQFVRGLTSAAGSA